MNDTEIIEIFKKFTQYFNDWTYLQKESEDHTEETNKPSCILFLDEDHHKPSFLITKIKDKFYSIVNILNSQYGHIKMLEYNDLLKIFEKDFKDFISFATYNSICIELSNEDIGLHEIITSPKARESFERYLRRFPLSYHPNDIERLNFFICAASRFCKKKINTELIEQYLVEDLNWPQKDAKWCRNRIDVGLEILKVNKQFYSYYI
ncbi:hypothetical protein [Nostoc sp.]|uniref:hypothetical protein n=1 Tax=Nostoc sp. TaxID=1180 RepID=UPI002FF5C806